MQRRTRPSDADFAAIIETGASLAASLVGAGIGLAVGGPPGALAGAAAGSVVEQTFRQTGQEVVRRFRAPAAAERVGATWIFALDVISARILNGEEPRRDSFFDRDARRGRSPAEELLEGVSVVAEDAYEERKVPYIGFLYSTFVFDAEISPARANQMLALAERLTYRQLVLLAILATDDDRQRLGKPSSKASAETPEQLGIRAELLNLVQSSLAWVDRGNEWPYTAVQLDLTKTEPFAAGQWLVHGMQLDRIPANDREDLVLRHWR
jgi:hypothetical protein